MLGYTCKQRIASSKQTSPICLQAPSNFSSAGLRHIRGRKIAADTVSAPVATTSVSEGSESDNLKWQAGYEAGYKAGYKAAMQQTTGSTTSNMSAAASMGGNATPTAEQITLEPEVQAAPKSTSLLKALLLRSPFKGVLLRVYAAAATVVATVLILKDLIKVQDLLEMGAMDFVIKTALFLFACSFEKLFSVITMIGANILLWLPF